MSCITLFSTYPLKVLKFPLSFHFPKNTPFLTSLYNALKISHIFKKLQNLVFPTSPHNVLKILCFSLFHNIYEILSLILNFLKFLLTFQKILDTVFKIFFPITHLSSNVYPQNTFTPHTYILIAHSAPKIAICYNGAIF